MKSIFGYLEGSGHEQLRLGRNLARHEEWAEAILPADAEALAIVNLLSIDVDEERQLTKATNCCAWQLTLYNAFESPPPSN